MAAPGGPHDDADLLAWLRAGRPLGQRQRPPGVVRTMVRATVAVGAVLLGLAVLLLLRPSPHTG